MVRGLMSKCPKCDGADVKKESGRLKGATMGRLDYSLTCTSATTAATVNCTSKKNPTYS